MYFCENCGSRLSDDARFCENCGFEISLEEPQQDVPDDLDTRFTMFESRDWKKTWKLQVGSEAYEHIGIILTNTADCTGNAGADFTKKLQKYIAYCQGQGTAYFVLNMATQKVISATAPQPSLSKVLDALKQIYDCAAPKYLLIIGDRNAIPSAQWENHANDSDEFVDSDLCYWTLDNTSPFERKKKSLHACVGRIPASASTGFPEACGYFDTVLTRGGSTSYIRSAALSAEEWLKVSRLNFADSCGTVYACPPRSFLSGDGLQTISPSEDYNFLCFNLHGSASHDHWVSGDHTRGYSPACLPQSGGPYILSTEACYGAKPIIRKSGSQSVLMTAIQSGCVAFCGSTQIAYGIPDSALARGAKPCAADILVGAFAGSVSKGNPIGQAYAEALVALAGDGGRMDAEDIKTMASFALYGDPSLRFCISGGSSTPSFESPRSKSSIVFPDVRLAVNKKIAKVSEKISQAITRCLEADLQKFADVTPRYYELSDHLGYKATFEKSDAGRTDFLSIYVDKQGNVDRIYSSK